MSKPDGHDHGQSPLLSRRVLLKGVGAGAVGMLIPWSPEGLAQDVGGRQIPTVLTPITRARMFASPQGFVVEIGVSPDGRWISKVEDSLFSALVGSRLSIAPRERPRDHRTIGYIAGWSESRRAHTWCHTGQHILTVTAGEKNEETVSVIPLSDLEKLPQDKNPDPKVLTTRGQFLGLSPQRPTVVAIGELRGETKEHDVWHVDLVSGARTRVLENTFGFDAIQLDWQLMPRLAMRQGADGSATIHQLRDGRWEPYAHVAVDDNFATSIVGINAAGTRWYLASPEGRDTSALYSVDMASGARTLIAAHPKADYLFCDTDLRSGEILASWFEHVNVVGRYADWRYESDQMFLESVLTFDAGHARVTQDGSLALVTHEGPTSAGAFYLLDRRTRRMTLLAHRRPSLAGVPLAQMWGGTLLARDGLELAAYVTMPPHIRENRPPAPLPMVLLVHGGPWARDSRRFEFDHQMLASRGYAVLSVNFRGSTGLGKALRIAGAREWGGRMQDDLHDAVAWAVREGIADPARVAIVGSSYGGYAALAGLAFSPGAFRCGIALAAVSDIEPHLVDRAATDTPSAKIYDRHHIGDASTPEGKAMLRARSPAHHAAAIRDPLLLVHGEADEIVKISQAEIMLAALKAAGKPVTYVRHIGGHSPSISTQRRSIFAVMEAFLARHLGGAAEPFDSSPLILTVEGAELVPGLAEALRPRP